MQQVLEKRIVNKLREIDRLKTEIKEAEQDWQQVLFQSMDFLFVFTGVVLVLKTLFEEGVLA